MGAVEGDADRARLQLGSSVGFLVHQREIDNFYCYNLKIPVRAISRCIGGIGYPQSLRASVPGRNVAISLSFRLPRGDNYNDAGTGSRVVGHGAGTLCRADPFNSPCSRGTGFDSHGLGPLAQRRSRDDGLSLCGGCGGTDILRLRMLLARFRRGARSRVHGGGQSVELDWSGAVLSSRSSARRIARGADRVARDVQRGRLRR